MHIENTLRGSSFAAAAALALGLAGCDTPGADSLLRPHRGRGHTHGSEARPGCLVDAIYSVDGDEIWPQGYSMTNLEDIGGGGGVGGGSLGGGENGGGLGFSMELYGYDGYIRLSWDGETVAELLLDEAFLTHDSFEILSYETPDGEVLEHHVYTKPKCPDLLPSEGPLTREELEALEARD